MVQRDDDAWKPLHLPQGVGRVRDVAVANGAIYLVGEVATGQSVIEISGRSVTAETLPGTGLTRFVASPPGSITVLGDDLFSRSSP